MKKRRKIQFHLPAAIALTVVTTVHTVAAWADDGGTNPPSTTTADAGGDAGDDDGDGGVRRSAPQCGSNGEARRGTVTLFGAGCC